LLLLEREEYLLEVRMFHCEPLDHILDGDVVGHQQPAGHLLLERLGLALQLTECAALLGAVLLLLAHEIEEVARLQTLVLAARSDAHDVLESDAELHEVDQECIQRVIREADAEDRRHE
jgi:hypothetical protein